MKKYLLTILLGAFGAMAIVTPAFAATSVSFTPVNMSVEQGQTFTLTIGVNPQGVKNYTAKMELDYPADLLEVKSFTFAPSWMPLAQSGYDLTDNINGVLIKTAGYPGGLSSAVAFGTVSFLAKKSGNGTITLNIGNSLALDASNQNVIGSATVQSAVAIAAPASTSNPTSPIIPIIPADTTIPTILAEEESVEENTVFNEEASAVQEPEVISQSILQSFLSASIGSVITFGTNSIVVGLLTTIAILVFAGYVIYTIIRKARRKNSEKLQ